ncbi:lysozyme-like [Pseudomyrmex gracilis]|uniref:lysozyme-like n=1 Tax=Pseudomyrmex gracilis TaxID=219809 RepID=UPI000994A727|nr:lysozyme-like [Pseudomyrmex gracilis]
MFARFLWAVAATVALFCVYSYAQLEVPPGAVSRACIGCICEVSSGCNTTIGCSESVCGPFAITWGYWADAGKPTLNGEPSTSSDAYPRCVNDPYCAARAIQGYMAKYAQDCTGNGVVDCEDYLRVHRLGAGACTGTLNSKYENKFKLCVRTFGQ